MERIDTELVGLRVTRSGITTDPPNREPDGSASAREGSMIHDDFCCAQQTGMHILVVEALLVIYLFYLGSKLILIDIRKPCRSSTCLVRYSWSLSSCAFPAGSCPAEVYEPANSNRNAACT